MAVAINWDGRPQDTMSQDEVDRCKRLYLAGLIESGRAVNGSLHSGRRDAERYAEKHDQEKIFPIQTPWGLGYIAT